MTRAITRIITALVAGGLVMAWAAPAAAAQWWVDADATDCAASGSARDPYPTLACAFANATLAPGDVILLKDAAAAYEGASTAGLASGAPGSAITIEPAPGAGPRLRSGLVVEGVDDWTVRGLVFEGGAGVAVTLRGGDRLVAEELQVVDWAGRAIVVGVAGSPASDATVTGNRIERVQEPAIIIDYADGARILDNDIADVACTGSSFTLCTDCGAEQCFACGDCLDADAAECNATQAFEIGGRVGIRVLGDSTGVEIARNFIHDFDSTQCAADGTRNIGVFITGSQARDGSIHHNWISRVGADADGYGVLMFQSAPGWRIERNLVTNVGRCGLCEGDFLFYGGLGTQWANNTVVNAAYGLDVRAAPGANFERNLVVAAGIAGARVQPDGVAAPPGFSANVYDAPSVGVWGDQAGTLPSWQRACGCDTDARSGDPGFANAGDYTPAPDSQAADLPVANTEFHGAGPDAGALEAVIALSAMVRHSEPERVIVQLDNRVAPPLQGFEACAGIAVEIDGSPVGLAGCSMLADDRLAVDLAETVGGEASVVLRAVGPSAIDSSRIGGRIGARLAEATLVVLNEAPPAAASGGTDSSTNTSDGATDGAADARAGGSDDCSCRSSTGGNAVALGGASVLVLLLSAPRRKGRSR